MIPSLTLTLILGLVRQINADYYEGRYNTSERIYRLFDTGTHWKRLVKSQRRLYLGRCISVVILPDFHMRRYRDDDHLDHAAHCIWLIF